ncbi:hypothetical protein NIES4101_28850 [Calothrix sp. NIES-4101]|nr:hypothetical protein NIES4101_28850 [Calothrix sp. NIES-4101]
MALGFVIVKLDEVTGDPAEYWDGSAFVADIDTADFIPTKPEARYVQGSTQAQDTSVDIVLREAESNIDLVP